MNQSNPKVVRRKVFIYIVVFAALILFYLWKMDSAWIGNTQLHTLMELTATLLALFIGVLALSRFYSRREGLFLFIGGAFLGVAFLDGYHAIVTSIFFDQLFPSPPEFLIPWSWNASRYFLAITLFVSWLWYKIKEKYGEKWELFPATVYISIGIYALASFLFFIFYPLPRAYYPELFFGRPEEFGAALFFLLALIGYLYKGGWKENRFEYWLVLSLIVGFVVQVLYMPFSFQLFDFQFDWAHILKNLSYIFVLIGLFIDVHKVFRQERKSQKELKKVELTLNNSSLVALTDIKGDITHANNKFIEVSKYTLNEILGQNHRILKSGFHTHGFYNNLWKTISGGKVWKKDIRNKSKDGSIYWVRSVLMPTFDENDKIDGYAAIRTPVTDLMVKYEEAYQKIMKGENVNPELKRIVKELQTGEYKIYNWLPINKDASSAKSIIKKDKEEIKTQKQKIDKKS